MDPNQAFRLIEKYDLEVDTSYEEHRLQVTVSGKAANGETLRTEYDANCDGHEAQGFLDAILAWIKNARPAEV
jgi:hypothetical protein